MMFESGPLRPLKDFADKVDAGVAFVDETAKILVHGTPIIGSKDRSNRARKKEIADTPPEGLDEKKLKEMVEQLRKEFKSRRPESQWGYFSRRDLLKREENKLKANYAKVLRERGRSGEKLSKDQEEFLKGETANRNRLEWMPKVTQVAYEAFGRKFNIVDRERSMEAMERPEEMDEAEWEGLSEAERLQMVYDEQHAQLEGEYSKSYGDYDTNEKERQQAERGLEHAYVDRLLEVAQNGEELTFEQMKFIAEDLNKNARDSAIQNYLIRRQGYKDVDDMIRRTGADITDWMPKEKLEPVSASARLKNQGIDQAVVASATGVANMGKNVAENIFGNGVLAAHGLATANWAMFPSALITPLNRRIAEKRGIRTDATDSLRESIQRAKTASAEGLGEVFKDIDAEKTVYKDEAEQRHKDENERLVEELESRKMQPRLDLEDAFDIKKAQLEDSLQKKTEARLQKLQNIIDKDSTPDKDGNLVPNFPENHYDLEREEANDDIREYREKHKEDLKKLKDKLKKDIENIPKDMAAELSALDNEYKERLRLEKARYDKEIEDMPKAMKREFEEIEKYYDPELQEELRRVVASLDLPARHTGIEAQHEQELDAQWFSYTTELCVAGGVSFVLGGPAYLAATAAMLGIRRGREYLHNAPDPGLEILSTHHRRSSRSLPHIGGDIENLHALWKNLQQVDEVGFWQWAKNRGTARKNGWLWDTEQPRPGGSVAPAGPAPTIPGPTVEPPPMVEEAEPAEEEPPIPDILPMPRPRDETFPPTDFGEAEPEPEPAGAVELVEPEPTEPRAPTSESQPVVEPGPVGAPAVDSQPVVEPIVAETPQPENPSQPAAEVPKAGLFESPEVVAYRDSHKKEYGLYFSDVQKAFSSKWGDPGEDKWIPDMQKVILYGASLIDIANYLKNNQPAGPDDKRRFKVVLVTDELNNSAGKMGDTLRGRRRAGFDAFNRAWPEGVSAIFDPLDIKPVPNGSDLYPYLDMLASEVGDTELIMVGRGGAVVRRHNRDNQGGPPQDQSA